MHVRFPQLTFDATIKIQHLLDHAVLLPMLRECGCLFVTGPSNRWTIGIGLISINTILALISSAY